MTTSQVLAVLGDEYETFKRVPDSDDTIYAYDSNGVHLTCSSANVVKIVSVFRPNSASYRGVQLLGRPVQDVVNELNANGIGTEEEDTGFWIAEAGVLLVEVKGIVDGIELYPE
jgi:hypothetical protein